MRMDENVTGTVGAPVQGVKIQVEEQFHILQRSMNFVELKIILDRFSKESNN